jgi:hypothetical protein
MHLISECGLRPVGTIRANAPEEMRNVDLKDRKSEGIEELKY